MYPDAAAAVLEPAPAARPVPTVLSPASRPPTPESAPAGAGAGADCRLVKRFDQPRRTSLLSFLPERLTNLLSRSGSALGVP